jgi:hypothetical protein
MSDTDGLIAFVTARLDEDEDEAAARDADAVDRSGWGRLSPERMLADVAAKRALIELAKEWRQAVDKGRDPKTDQVLELLALPYFGHPHYREEWQLP